MPRFSSLMARKSLTSLVCQTPTPATITRPASGGSHQCKGILASMLAESANERTTLVGRLTCERKAYRNGPLEARPWEARRTNLVRKHWFSTPTG